MICFSTIYKRVEKGDAFCRELKLPDDAYKCYCTEGVGTTCDEACNMAAEKKGLVYMSIRAECTDNTESGVATNKDTAQRLTSLRDYGFHVAWEVRGQHSPPGYYDEHGDADAGMEEEAKKANDECEIRKTGKGDWVILLTAYV